MSELSVKLKVVLVGDSQVGKTWLAQCMSGIVVGDPITSHDYCFEATADGRKTFSDVYDTHGGQQHDGYRPLMYPLTDVILVCFSLVSRSSWLAVKTKWLPEVSHYCPGVPLIAVGLKCDLIANVTYEGGQDVVTQQEGQSMANDIGARRYIQCSSVTRDGISELMTLAAETALPQTLPVKHGRPERRCIIA